MNSNVSDSINSFNKLQMSAIPALMEPMLQGGWQMKKERNQLDTNCRQRQVLGDTVQGNMVDRRERGLT